MPIEIRIYDEEVVLRLDQFPKKIREAIRAKFTTDIFPGFKQRLSSRPPGKFLDPQTLETGVVDQGQLVIGYIESTDKTGTYPIYPVKARLLRFVAKSGDLVFTKRVAHPFLKGSLLVQSEFVRDEEWIIKQLEEAVEEVQF